MMDIFETMSSFLFLLSSSGPRSILADHFLTMSDHRTVAVWSVFLAVWSVFLVVPSTFLDPFRGYSTITVFTFSSTMTNIRMKKNIILIPHPW